MIVKNEEDTLKRCLDSVAGIVDEIIIVDTGSSDRTNAVALQYTDRVQDFIWIDDFAAARNFAFSLATEDYIFWLDADDVLEEPDRIKLLELKRVLDPSVDSVSMDYHLAFDEFGNVTSKLRRNRLVKRTNQYRWIGAVHEYLEVWGNLQHSDIAVTHRSIRHESERNLRIYETRLQKGEVFSPRDTFYFANELKDHGQYERATSYYRQFLDSQQGWIEDCYSACSKMADCYHMLGDQEKELAAVLDSLRYGKPRAEFCCRLGFYFLKNKDFDTAIFWYTQATVDVDSKLRWVQSNQAVHTWLPHLQLCVCYDRIGNYQMAHVHNEKAAYYRPDDPRILYNRTYLAKLLSPEKV
ncbi:glycosyltransferase [Fontibacillus sp. BL9]|uniref:tetratricopeptide repeat-containing glycosyltransferase family 2 protein n=1 Tax=Fontibacillus sp. BL9 TaxID=3389971 RepID=UPI00397B8A75